MAARKSASNTTDDSAQSAENGDAEKQSQPEGLGARHQTTSGDESAFSEGQLKEQVPSSATGAKGSEAAWKTTLACLGGLMGG